MKSDTDVAMSAAVNIDRKNMSPPSKLLAFAEGYRALLEASALIPSLPWLNNLPRGDGHHVYILPGFMATGASTTVLRAYLDHLGYQTSSWGFGRNLGPRQNLEAQLEQRVTELAERTGKPVSIIGQSLGGVFAREIAKAIPEHVRQVITLGSPFGSSEDHSEGTNPLVLRLFEMANGESISQLRERMYNLQDPPPVPCTSIYSKSDGVAAWRSCLEQDTPLTENIEIYASHCGMGFNPAVYYLLADRLAQTENAWSKFAHGGSHSACRNWIYPEATYVN